MKWYDVGAAVVAELLTVPDLASIYGVNIRAGSDSGDKVSPLLEWFLISDTETELWAPCTLQFDQWCRTMTELATSELALRRRFHVEVPTVFAGLGMWAEYLDGNSLANPNRDGYFARAVRFRFTPLRDRYQPSQTP